LERAGRVLDLVAEEKEKDEADDIGDVICVCGEGGTGTRTGCLPVEKLCRCAI